MREKEALQNILQAKTERSKQVSAWLVITEVINNVVQPGPRVLWRQLYCTYTERVVPKHARACRHEPQ